MLGKNRISLIVSLIIGLLAGLSLIIVLPSNTPYSIVNTGGNGLSKLAVAFHAEPVRAIPGSYPDKPWESALILVNNGSASPLTVRSILSFASKGGLVIVSGDYRFLSSIATAAGLHVKITDNVIYDPVVNAGDRYHPLLRGPSCPYPLIAYRPLELIPEEGYDVVARTSNFSYADENNNGYLDLTENISSYIVGVRVPIGSGYIIILSSPQSFTNQYIDENIEFIKCLINHRRVYIDQSQQANNPVESIRLYLKYGSPGNLQAIAIVLSAVSGVLGYIVNTKHNK